MDTGARPPHHGPVLAKGRPRGVVGLLAAGLLAASAGTAVAATKPVVGSAPTVTGSSLVGGSFSIAARPLLAEPTRSSKPYSPF